MTILDFMTKYEPIWLFLVLFPELLAGLYSAWILKREFDYDANKDLAKAQKKTRTSKKTTQSKDGGTVVEESTEVTEPASPGGPQGESQ
jgi:hypothetical protein